MHHTRPSIQRISTITRIVPSNPDGPQPHSLLYGQAGAIPFVPFKSIHTGAGGGLWAKMFHYFNFNRDEFLGHYHKRSNVESTFAMIKAKFGDSVRSKTETAQVNEALCKVLCHNLCVLIQSTYELGVEAMFWGEEPERESSVEDDPILSDQIEALAWV